MKAEERNIFVEIRFLIRACLSLSFVGLIFDLAPTKLVIKREIMSFCRKCHPLFFYDKSTKTNKLLVSHAGFLFIVLFGGEDSIINEKIKNV